MTPRRASEIRGLSGANHIRDVRPSLLSSLALHAQRRVESAGAWDVDGTGVSKIEDESLALAIQAKINTFWRNTAILAVTTDVLFALAPTLFQF